MSWLKNLSVAKKINVLVALAIVGIALVGSIALWSTKQLTSSADDLGRQQLPAVRNMTLTDMMHDGLMAVVYHSIVAAQSGDTEEVDTTVEDSREFADNFTKYLAAIDELELRSTTREAVSAAKPDVQAYVAKAQQLVAMCAAGKADDALNALPDLQEKFDRLEESLGALGELIESDADEGVTRAESIASISERSVITALLVGITMSMLLGLYIAKHIVVPLNTAVSVLESGDMDRLSTIDSADEFGRMAKAVAATVRSMHEGVEKLAQQKATIEASASEIEQAMRSAEAAASESKRLAAEAARVASMVENSTACMMFADESLTLSYLNPAARESLTLLAASGENGFDVREGKTLDSFFVHPSGNRAFFANTENLPFHTRRQVGAETADVVFSAIFDDNQRRLGTLVSWEIVTEQLDAKRRADEAAAEAARVASMVENAPGCMMYADADLTLRYLNPAAKEAAAKIGLDGDALVGRKLADFYRHPEGNQRFFGSLGNLPWSQLVDLHGESVRLTCSAILDTRGSRLGLLVSWEIVTERVRAEQASKESSERELRQAQELQAKVERMLVAVDAASRGDLTQIVDVAGADAIGQMGESIARLLGDFRKSIGQIRVNAEQLATASEQLTGVSQRMSSEAEETSTQVGVVADAASKVEDSVRTASQNTDAMTESIVEIARSASTAAKVARTAVETADSTNATVADLDRSSEEIGKILKTITAIAQQTNLLALNATIEAARAGEMGKGFAVVANEVKELAKETAKATTDIGSKIEAIQTGSRGAVDAISKIGGIIKEIDGLQTTIAAAVEQQTASTKEITNTLNGATSASTAITANMSQVATTARQTSSGAANSLDVAHEVSRMAEELRTLVGHFRC